MLSRNFLYHGIDEDLARTLPLRAGPLTLLFDAGDLRSIRLGEREILRRVYVALRDSTWGTIPAQLSNMQCQVEDRSFAIEYDVLQRRDEIDFAWHARLSGSAEGRIIFSMDGAARTAFLKNRIGFCVLFPASVSGQAALVEHVDGSREETRFPLDICADQPVRPFENLSGVAMSLGSPAEAVVHFRGDVFEMEDQRLWTDASFKVFCTPLSLPYPVEIQAGTRVNQQIELDLRISANQAKAGITSVESTRQALAFGFPAETAWMPIPRIGLGSASHDQTLRSEEIERLKDLRLDHLRVDLPLSVPDYSARLKRAAAEAQALGIGLEAALFVSAERAAAQLAELRRCVDDLRPPVIRWLVYPDKEIYAGGSPTAPVLAAARAYLFDFCPDTAFCTGTNTDYIFLKHTPPPSQAEQVCIALNPQVHAFDNLSLLETLQGQAMVLESARLLAAGRPIVVSPITLKPRFNPHAQDAQPAVLPGTLPAQVDPRQRSLFGAGWTLGSLRAMVSAGASSVTYYETTGWRGVMECIDGSPWPAAFNPLPGIVFPLYHILADIAEFSAGQAALLNTSWSQSVSAIALRSGGKLSFLLANHSGETQIVDLGDRTPTGSMRRLDETNAEQAMRSPARYRSEGFIPLLSPRLTIPPYAYIRIDWRLNQF